jgi:proliferating cell nuclear antigen
MLEARLSQAAVLRKLLEAVKVLVNEANFDCGEAGISLQAMDTSHVALVSLLLRSSAFEHYRCDRPLSLGLNLQGLSGVLKCAGNTDVLTIRADEKESSLGLLFEGSRWCVLGVLCATLAAT